MSLRERTFYGLLKQAILLLLFCSVVFASPMKPLAQYWKETALSWTAVNQEMSPPVCHQSAINFWACVEAARYVMNKLQLKRDLAARPIQTAVAKKVLNIGGFSLTARDAGRAPLRDLAAMKREQERVRDYWKKLYEQNGSQYDFKKLWRWLAKKMPTEQEAETSAGAYNTFLGISRDPHTRIVPKAFGDEEDAKSEDEYFGVGVVLARLADQTFVRKVTGGSPAERVGLQVMDVFLEVDSVPVRGLSLEAIGQKLTVSGSKKISVKFSRNGAVHEITLTPEKIIRPKVVYEVIGRGKSQIGYLKISDFSGTANCDHAGEAVREFEHRKVTGIVLDLRGNPGGRLNDALCIANLFFPVRQRIYSVIPLSGMAGPEFYGDTSVTAATSLPMVTLVDAASASASELLAGALQDHARSLVVGQRTFGKGTVQYTYGWKASTVINFIETRAAFFLPSGRSNQLSGNEPDLAVPEAHSSVRLADLYLNPTQVIGARKVAARDFSALRECVKDQADYLLETETDAALNTARFALACHQKQASLRWEYVSGSDL